MFTSLRNITALIAVLAVALLGSLAISNRASDRYATINENLISMCERHNVARGVANEAIDILNIQHQALEDALEIAQRESNQRTQDRIDYARIESALEQIKPLDSLPTTDCEESIKGN